MRWEYEAPEKNLFLVDGKMAWFYVPNDHTVTRVPAKQSTDFRTPLALLAGETKVSRVCARVEIADEKPSSDKDVLLHCVLRGTRKEAPSTSGKSVGVQGTDSEDADAGRTGGEREDAVFFETVKETGELVRLLVRESGGVEIEFRFENWRMNPPLPESMFHFEVPAGVAIVNGEIPEGSQP